MPHKFNAARRHKIDKARHRVTNWSDYNENLRRRGDLTIWTSEDALSLWPVPRRAKALIIAPVMRQAESVPLHLAVDSTGLKLFDEGNLLAQKAKSKGTHRRWRMLHLGLDIASGRIVCTDLTHNDVGDTTALPGLLDQLDAPVVRFLADGAYDEASTRELLRQQHEETIDVVIPPQKNAVINPQSTHNSSVRDRHIVKTRSNGRMA